MTDYPYATGPSLPTSADAMGKRQSQTTWLALCICGTALAGIGFVVSGVREADLMPYGDYDPFRPSDPLQLQAVSDSFSVIVDWLAIAAKAIGLTIAGLAGIGWSVGAVKRRIRQ